MLNKKKFREEIIEGEIVQDISRKNDKRKRERERSLKLSKKNRCAIEKRKFRHAVRAYIEHSVSRARIQH